MMPPRTTPSDDLLRRFEALAETYARLSQALAQAARDVDSGSLPDASLLIEVASSREAFHVLIKDALATADELGLATAPAAQIASLNELLCLVRTVADAHRRRDALALLERVARIRHAEATFEPLRGVQILAQALWEAINATLPPQIHADAGALADGTHPFAHLLELVERGEFVDDERWHVLEESTAANFGTPVSVAAARGRLRVVDAAITEPEPQPKPVEPVEAAPEPVEVPAPIAVQAVDVEPEIILPSLPAPVVEPQPLVALWQAEAGVDEAPRPRKSRPWLRAAAITSQAAALLLAAAVTFVAVVPALFGARSLVVAGSSMEPSVPRGSVVFVQPMAPTNAHIGDVITFAVNGEANNLVTHRVVQVEQDDQGLALRTEGDANNTEDVWRVRASDTVGRVVLWVPMAGFVMAAASLPLVRIATVALLLMVLVAQLFRRRTSQPSSLPAPSLG